MDSRNLLYLALQRTPQAICQEIVSAGWAVYAATDVAHAKKLVADGDCSVGLVVFERSDDSLCLEIEDLVTACPAMEWVALMHDTCLMTERFLDFILDNFYNYQKWPPDPASLLISLEHARERAGLRQRRMAADSRMSESAMIGNSPAMKHVIRSIRKIAAVDTPTLIIGESGTGKELAAVEIHRRSSRSNGAFVAVNCGALPAQLIQSELFGHERGSFTGAYYSKKGLLESAVGGTVFLDEIGDLPLDLQTNLLRFLQEHTINRIGSTNSIPLQVRVIAATHLNLENAVKERRFREDLYYRLNVLQLALPPLRERTGDVPLLAQHFFQKFSNEKQLRLKGFSHRAQQAMINHRWPGNVREMINRIRRAMVMCESSLITSTDLGFEKRDADADRLTLDQAREAAERSAILLSLQATDYNISQAALQLEVSRVTLYRLMQKYDLWRKTRAIRKPASSPRHDIANMRPVIDIPSPTHQTS